MEIIVKSINSSRNYNAIAGETVNDLINNEAILEFFGAEASDILDSLEKVNDMVITDGARSIIANSALQEGMVLEFDLESEEAEPAVSNAAATQGVVTVHTSGGLQSSIVPITVGVSTVHDAIYNDIVRARSGMTDTQLSNCVITLNEDDITSAAASSKVLASGDVITLTARSASTKGC